MLKVKDSPQIALPDFARKIRHPAMYSSALMPFIARYISAGDLILDPFGGTGGRIAALALRIGASVVVNELEYNVIANAAGTYKTCADAMLLPFASNTFCKVITSPTFANRMADQFTDHTRRNTYTAGFGAALHKNNTGALQWGEKYRAAHRAAWGEAIRVLAPGGVFVMDCKDHIRAGKRQYVTDWHVKTLQELGLIHIDQHAVCVPSNRQGQNGAARVGYHMIHVFRKGE